MTNQNNQNDTPAAPRKRKTTPNKNAATPSAPAPVVEVVAPKPRSDTWAWVPWLLFFVVLFLLVDQHRKHTKPQPSPDDAAVVVDDPVAIAVAGCDQEAVRDYAAFYEAVAAIVETTKTPIPTAARDATLGLMPVRIPALGPVVELRLQPFKDLPQAGGWKDAELAAYVAVWRQLSQDLLNTLE